MVIRHGAMEDVEGLSEARAILEVTPAAPEEEATDPASYAHGPFAPLGGV